MAINDLAPVPRRSTVENIAEQLRNAVMAGHLTPGTQLGEANLAETFAVSRGTLREAMQRLVSEGLLIAIPNRGTFVRELTLEDMVDVYRTRAVIERGALEIVLDSSLEATCVRLAAIVTELRAAAERGDGPAVSDADQEFHRTLVECSGSPRLIRAMRTLVVETRMVLGELRTTYEDLLTPVREHEQLLDAIRSGTPEQAKHVLRAHLDEAVERLVAKHEPSAG